MGIFKGLLIVMSSTSSSPKNSGFRIHQRLATGICVVSALVFITANSLFILRIPYYPLGLILNTLGTVSLASCLVFLVWANHRGSKIFHLFAAGGLLLLMGRIAELPWFTSLLMMTGLRENTDRVVATISISLADMGYCVFAWAMAFFSISAFHHEMDARAHEQQLRMSEERYRRLVELTPDWIFETDSEGIIQLTNDAARSILGYSKQDLEGKELTSLADPEHKELLANAFRQVLSGHRQSDLEVRFPHAAGGSRWLSLNLVAVIHTEDTARGIQGDGHDITQRREIAEALLRRKRHLSCLAEIQALLLGHPGMQGLFERVLPNLGRTSGANRVYVIENYSDADGNLYMQGKAEWRSAGINDGLGSSHGQDLPYSPAFVRWAERFRQNQTISEVITDLPEGERALLEPLEIRAILLIPLVTSGQWIGFLGFDNCVKTEAWGMAEVDLFRSAAAAISLAIGRINAEEEKDSLERKMLEGQKLESLGVLAGGIAHDFNNLLTTIMGNANLAHDQLPEDSPVRHHLASIDIATQRAADLAHQMLAYTGRGQLASTEFDLNATIQELMTLLSASISKKINLSCVLSENLPFVKGDPTQVHQVIMNLVINAAEAIGDENGIVTIRTGTEHVDENQDWFVSALLSPNTGDFVTFEVTDTGHGMDASTLKRIFDPFFTTKVTGHGLGLAAVLGIVRSHGGGIRVLSKKGQGTTFVVYLPAGERHILAAGVTGRVEPGSASGTVLVADDEENVRDLVENVLIMGGYHVITACDGIEAIKAFKDFQEDVDLVILDLSMPNLNGAEALAQIRALSATVPVILSSGFNEGDVEEHFSESHLSGFIQKPYRPKDLLDYVSEVLAQQESCMRK